MMEVGHRASRRLITAVTSETKLLLSFFPHFASKVRREGSVDSLPVASFFIFVGELLALFRLVGELHALKRSGQVGRTWLGGF